MSGKQNEAKVIRKSGRTLLLDREAITKSAGTSAVLPLLPLAPAFPPSLQLVLT